MKIHPVYNFINRDSEFFKILRQLPRISEDGPWVAGGSVWKSIESIPLDRDIDLFFKSVVQCEEWYRTLLTMPYVHRIVSDTKTNRYNTSLQYHVSVAGYNKTVTIQLISFKFFDNITDLLNGFDFTACQFGFDGKNLYSGDTSFDDLRNREIIFNTVRDETATGIHLNKYIKRGFKIPESQKQKYDKIMEIHNREMSKIRPALDPLSVNPFVPPTIRLTMPNRVTARPTTGEVFEQFVATSLPVATTINEDDYAYPRPIAVNPVLSVDPIEIPLANPFYRPPEPGISPSNLVDLTQLTQTENPCVEIPTPSPYISSGVSMREVDMTTSNSFDDYFRAPILRESPGISITEVDSDIVTTNDVSNEFDAFFRTHVSPLDAPSTVEEAVELHSTLTPFEINQLQTLTNNAERNLTQAITREIDNEIFSQLRSQSGGESLSFPMDLRTSVNGNSEGALASSDNII